MEGKDRIRGSRKTDLETTALFQANNGGSQVKIVAVELKKMHDCLGTYFADTVAKIILKNPLNYSYETKIHDFYIY